MNTGKVPGYLIPSGVRDAVVKMRTATESAHFLDRCQMLKVC